MWWQIALAFLIAFQLGFFAACILAASRRPAPVWAEAGEYSVGREAAVSGRR